VQDTPAAAAACETSVKMGHRPVKNWLLSRQPASRATADASLHNRRCGMTAF